MSSIERFVQLPPKTDKSVNYIAGDNVFPINGTPDQTNLIINAIQTLPDNLVTEIEKVSLNQDSGHIYIKVRDNTPSLRFSKDEYSSYDYINHGDIGDREVWYGFSQNEYQFTLIASDNTKVEFQ
jgi:hypothetical protein